MSRLQKTSRYFLQHLLPHEALNEEQRARLAAVLCSDIQDEQRALAEELSETLAEAGIFERLAPGFFRDPSSGHSFRLPFLAGRGKSLLGEGANASGAAPAPAEMTVPETAPEPRPEPEPQTEPQPEPESDVQAPSVAALLPRTELTRQVESILAAIQFEGREPGLNQGLVRLLSLLTHWFPGSLGILYRQDPEENGDEDPVLRALEPETLAPGHPYRIAMETGEVQILSNGESRYGWFPPRDFGAGATWVLLPLELDQEVWGLLELRLPAGRDPEELLESLRIFGQALSHQMHNHRALSQVVYVDWLTQVYNRSFLDIQLPLEIERAMRNDEPLALLVADLDNFKQINDTYGHDVGDRVLREFGQLIRNTLRKVDVVFRYGGEEFVILIPRLELDSAYRAAERLRDAIAAHPFAEKEDGSKLRVTASLGGAIFPQDALADADLFKAADEACYRAKRAGKNCVIFAERQGGPD